MNVSPTSIYTTSAIHKIDEQADLILTRLNESEKQTMLENRSYSEMLKERTGHHLLLTAHRGTGPTSVFGSSFPDKYLPENTLQAIKAAILQGADAIEIDIFKSGDGKVVVTHDDEIWRNAFQVERSGIQLPEGETTESYLVGQKTVEELKRIPLGRNGETMPTLAEVMELVNDANQTLTLYGKNTIILNIELKDAGAVNETLDLLADDLDGHASAPLESIVFCSFKHEALKELKEKAEQRGMSGINIAPGIKTADLFGKDNMNPDFSLKDPNAGYHPQAMDNLRKLVEGNDFQGYDGILWDLREPIVDLAVTGNKAIHASTSDFRQYADNRDFSHLLLELSNRVDTFFKCDNVDDARKVLLESSILLNGIGIQMMYKQNSTGEDYFYFYRPNDQQDTSAILQTGAKKPIAYSKLERN
ncbi:glycerophosphodiester phosphodiesterase [Photorhabdus sp. RW14-46]|uniref:glycerophosphodiester phosphodiesterase n=1 Tax=Photorhabdus sp. RW14-46 TaxID=2100168 RepID=UPI0013F42CA8|nr:glycerophosphodiester phosphodiesterase family protein [Photorhabdus sp. RW14-46]NHB60033.1 hypothetical protein [Photorhabdus sp. RW14-46]